MTKDVEKIFDEIALDFSEGEIEELRDRLTVFLAEDSE